MLQQSVSLLGYAVMQSCHGDCLLTSRAALPRTIGNTMQGPVGLTHHSCKQTGMEPLTTGMPITIHRASEFVSSDTDEI